MANQQMWCASDLFPKLPPGQLVPPPSLGLLFSNARGPQLVTHSYRGGKEACGNSAVARSLFGHSQLMADVDLVEPRTLQH